MTYDGLGNRLEMTAAGVTTRYELDGGRALSADAAGTVTHYLYGLAPIGELTTEWAYPLPDGAGSPRQLVDADGAVALASSYTPCPLAGVLRKGDTLETFGTGRFTQGYFGGIMDSATGLIYVGSGQYYDPATGRFLTRDARPGQNNPYTPIDPTGALLGPLALLTLAYGRKKSRGRWDTLVILLVLGVSVGMSLAACNNTDPVTVTATKYAELPTPVVQVTQAGTEIASTPTPIWTPTLTPTATCTVTLTPMPTPTGPNLDYDVLTWGNNDLDETWRQQRSQWVWEWLGRRGGFWGSGHPDVKTLVTFLLIGEGVGLMNGTSSGNRFAGLRVMVWYMRSLFDDADGITAKRFGDMSRGQSAAQRASQSQKQANK